MSLCIYSNCSIVAGFSNSMDLVLAHVLRKHSSCATYFVHSLIACREKPELPYPYACALRASLQACVSTPKGTPIDYDTARQAEMSPDTSTPGSSFSVDKESMLGVKVSALEETFKGEIVVGRWILPLFSRRMHAPNASHARADNGSGREIPVAAMSLSDAIHSANTQLKVCFWTKASGVTKYPAVLGTLGIVACICIRTDYNDDILSWIVIRCYRIDWYDRCKSWVQPCSDFVGFFRPKSIGWPAERMQAPRCCCLGRAIHRWGSTQRVCRRKKCFRQHRHWYMPFR